MPCLWIGEVLRFIIARQYVRVVVAMSIYHGLIACQMLCVVAVVEAACMRDGNGRMAPIALI